MRLRPSHLLLSASLALGSASAQSSVPPPSPPPMQTHMVSLKDIPRKTYAGLQQDRSPEPIWSFEHKEPVGYPDISPDGRWIVLARYEDASRHSRTLIVIDLVNRRATDYPIPAPGLVDHVIFDRTGKSLLGIVDTTAGHTFARWDFPAMTLTQTSLGPGVGIAAAFNHAQDKAVVMRDSGIVDVYELPGGRKLYEVAYNEGQSDRGPNAFAISPDDMLVASGITVPEHRFIRWRLSDGSRVESPIVPQQLEWGRSVSYVREGTTLLVGGHFGLELRDSISNEVLGSFPGNGLRSFHLLPESNLATAPIGDGGTFGVIDTISGQLRMWAQHTSGPPVHWVCLSPDRKTVYSGDARSIRAWDLEEELTRRANWLTAGRIAREIFLRPDGKRLIAVGETVDTWSLVTKSLVQSQTSRYLRRPLPPEPGTTPVIDRKALGTFVVGEKAFMVVSDVVGPEVIEVGGGSTRVRLGAPASALNGPVARALSSADAAWRSLLVKPVQLPEVFPADPWFRMEASPDGTQLLVSPVVRAKPTVTLWSLTTGRRLAVLADETVVPSLARFSRDGQTVALANERGEVVLITLTPAGPSLPEFVTGRVLGSARTYVGISDLLFPSPDRLYVATSEGTLTLWAKTAGKWYKQSKYSFGAPVTRLAVSPEQTKLAVILDTHHDGTLLIIDLATGAVTTRLDDNAADAVFLSETQLATSSIRIWTLQ